MEREETTIRIYGMKIKTILNRRKVDKNNIKHHNIIGWWLVGRREVFVMGIREIEMMEY